MQVGIDSERDEIEKGIKSKNADGNWFEKRWNREGDKI